MMMRAGQTAIDAAARAAILSTTSEGCAMERRRSRTSTEVGLGKVTAEGRTTAVRERPARDTPNAPAAPNAPTAEEVRRANKATLRTETRWRVTPPEQVIARARDGARKTEPPPSHPPAEAPATNPPPSARKTRSARPSIREDDVGRAAVGLGKTSASVAERVPRVVRARADLASAPIGPREAFLLALVDGSTSVQGLVDVAAMPEAEVVQILERLRRLGIVTLG